MGKPEIQETHVKRAEGRNGSYFTLSEARATDLPEARGERVANKHVAAEPVAPPRCSVVYVLVETNFRQAISLLFLCRGFGDFKRFNQFVWPTCRFPRDRELRRYAPLAFSFYFVDFRFVLGFDLLFSFMEHLFAKARQTSEKYCSDNSRPLARRLPFTLFSS